MPLYATIRISDTSEIAGQYHPDENRVVVTRIKSGREIAEKLYEYAQTNYKLFSIAKSIDLSSGQTDFTSESAPWLSHLVIQGNSIDGLSSRNDTFSLSIEVPDVISEWFWTGPIKDLTIGTRPYGV